MPARGWREEEDVMPVVLITCGAGDWGKAWILDMFNYFDNCADN
jgi:hypothetical protein